MAASTTQKLLTAEEFALLPDPKDGSRQELVRGEVIRMSRPGFLHGKVLIRLGQILENYNDVANVGHFVTDTGVITEEDPDSVRGPDVAFWCYASVPEDTNPVSYPRVSPDLCVEINSPGNSKREMSEKIREYFACGVRIVWFIEPEKRTVTVYRQPDDGQLLLPDATLTAEDVLPGFSCPVTKLFPKAKT